MSINENKAVVRRFINEVLSGGNVDLIEELLAPNYVNRLGDVGLDGFKAMLSSMNTAMPARNFEITDLVAEGDSVVFRGTFNVTLAGGKKNSFRIITYYRLSNGKIMEDDPISRPDLTQLMGDIMSPQSAS